MTEKKQRIAYLDVARSIAIISITFNHAVNRSFNTSVNQLSEFLSIPVWLTIIKTILYVFSRIGVPLFVMISGSLLISHNYDNVGVRRFIKHNWLQLCITTEIWLAIMFWYKQIFSSSTLFTEGIIKCLIKFVSTLLFINPETMGSMWYMEMILCVYLLIPIISVGLKKIDWKYFLIPMAIVIFSSFVLPDINGFLGTIGTNFTLDFKLSSTNVFSMYIVYILLGFFISSLKLLEKVKTPILITLFVVSFSSYCAFQFWIYTKEYDYNVGYDSIFPLLTSVFLFELLRRIDYKEFIKKVSMKLSRISFGIYFIHICIMEGLVAVINHTGWNFTHLSKFLILESVSFVGSVVVIMIFRKNKWISKNILGIK